jgi:transposase
MDESGFSESPVVRRCWAPRGKTPVLRPKGRNWHWISAVGALAYRRDGRSARVLLMLQRGAIRTAGVMRFLRHLRRHVAGRVILIWDGLQAHRAKAVREWAAENKHWLRIEVLPAYAPELNPVEGLWAWLKGTCLANVCTEELGDLTSRVRNGAKRARHKQTLLRAFLAKSDLSLE